MCQKEINKKVFNNLLTKVLDTDSYSKENLVNLPKARNVVSLSTPTKKMLLKDSKHEALIILYSSEGQNRRKQLLNEQGKNFKKIKLKCEVVR